MPGRVVHGHVKMADARRHVQRARPEYAGKIRRFSVRYVDDDQSAGQSFRNRRVDDDFRQAARWPAAGRRGRTDALASVGDELAAEEIADQRDHQVGFVFEREVTGIE